MKSRHAILHFIFQLILAILQSMAALGLLGYLMATEPYFAVGGETMLLFLIGVIFFAFVHAVYQVVDDALNLRVARAGSPKLVNMK